MKDLSHPWIWLVVCLLLFFCVPYFFAGMDEPLVFGAPLWFLSVLAASCGRRTNLYRFDPAPRHRAVVTPNDNPVEFDHH